MSTSCSCGIFGSAVSLEKQRDEREEKKISKGLWVSDRVCVYMHEVGRGTEIVREKNKKGMKGGREISRGK